MEKKKNTNKNLIDRIHRSTYDPQFRTDAPEGRGIAWLIVFVMFWMVVAALKIIFS